MISNIEQVEKVSGQSIRKDIPHFEAGDTIKMRIKVKEAEKIRIHLFEGTVIKKTGRGIAATFTVRKISFGEGVERTFPINSPVIEKIDVVSRGLVKRAKLYYLRDRLGKSARVKVDQSQKITKEHVHAVASSS
jgi:large subunit ribosomal protein L19